MVQILCFDNPLFGKGLAWGQRLCYFNAILYFLSGIPRIIFFIIPATFILLKAQVVFATGAMVLLYVFPHLIHATLANDRIQGKYRHFLWNEVYETVIAWYIAIGTTMVLINPHKAHFKVTAKGGLIHEQYLDWYIARSYILFFSINMLSIIVGSIRLMTEPWDITLSLLITMMWTLYNILILGGAFGASIEEIQVRKSPRVNFQMPMRVRCNQGALHDATMRNYSEGGIGLHLNHDVVLNKGDDVTFLFKNKLEEYEFPGFITFKQDCDVGIQIKTLTHQQHIAFIQCTFAQVGMWSAWQKQIAPAAPLQSIREIAILNVQSYVHMIKYMPKIIQDILRIISRVFLWFRSFAPQKPKNDCT